MINPEQAIDLRAFLINELHSNGFGEVVTQVYERLEEDYEHKEFEGNANYFLNFFLKESIEILENLSNQNYQKLLDRINNYNEGQIQVEHIKVELLSLENESYFDLKDLPDYSKIVLTFRKVLAKINEED